MLDFLRELTRRKVWLFGGIYLALGWVLLQVAALLENTLKLPDWIDQSVLVLLVLCFPVALLLAWAQESGKGGPDDSQNWAGLPEGSVAILPFRDLTLSESGARQAALIASNLSARLSHRFGFHILAGGATERFASLQVGPREVSQDLKVRYILTGTIDGLSVAEASDVTFTIQLQNGKTGEQFWSKTYRGSLADREMVPSEKMARLTTSLDWVIRGADADALKEAGRETISAAAITFRAWSQIQQGKFDGNWVEAERLLARALDIDDNHPRALALRAKAISMRKPYSPEELTPEVHQTMMADAQKAVLNAPRDPWVLSMVASVHGYAKLFDKAREYTDIALDLDPDNALALTMKCENAFMAGNFEEFQSTFARLAEKHPDDPVGYVWYTFGANYQYFLGNLDKALEYTWRARDINSEMPIWIETAVPLLVDLGREDEALELWNGTGSNPRTRSRRDFLKSLESRPEELKAHDAHVMDIWERLGVFED